jgi:hypothetical protein
MKKLLFILMLFTIIKANAQSIISIADSVKKTTNDLKKENPGSILQCSICKKGWDTGKEVVACKNGHAKLIATNSVNQATKVVDKKYKCDCCEDKSSVHKYCCRYLIMGNLMSKNFKLPPVGNKLIPPPIEWDTLVPDGPWFYSIKNGDKNDSLIVLSEIGKNLSSYFTNEFKCTSALIRKTNGNNLALIVMSEDKSRSVESLIIPLKILANGYYVVSGKEVQKINSIGFLSIVQGSAEALNNKYIGHVTLLK